MGTVAKKIMMGSGAVALPSDDQFNRVSFLSHFDGANNGVNNAFDDGSASNHTITANGNVTQGSFNPFGTNWGVDFPDSDASDSSTQPFVNVTSHADLAIGANDDYTFEYFIFFRDNTYDQVVLDGREALNYSNGTVVISAIRGLLDYQGNTRDPVVSGALTWAPHSTGDASGLTTLQTNDVMALGAWNHFAAVRNSGTVNLYLNGVRQTANYTSNTTVSTQGDWKFGCLANPGAVRNLDFKNIISNFRYVKGSAVYSGSSFTVPTSPLTAITNTKLLLFQSNRFVDNSATGHTLTTNGLPAVTPFGPFLTSAVYDPAVNGASAFFDGDNDSLTTGDSADFVLGDTFTLEAWVYPTVSESNDYPMIMSQAEGYPTGWYFSLRYTNEVNFYLNAADNAGGAIDLNTDGSDPVQLNAWNHIALSVSSGTGYIYVNGARKSSAATGINNNLDRSSTTFRVGVHNAAGSYDFDGYICDARIVKGTALYSGTTYTIPTAPLTAITNTKLLLNMSNGQAIDSTAQNNLTLYGTAKTSTAQKKFGTASLLLDGNSDYVAIPAINLTNSFTMEFFAYLNAWPNSSNFDMFYGEASSIYMGFTSGINGSGSDRSIQLAYDPSDYSTIVQFNVNSAMNAGAWHHVAITKNSSNVHVCYIDGTSVTATNATGANTFSTTGTHFIGRGYSPSYHYFGGYIDDFRISQLVRYTSNFTAPTAAFADKGQ